MNATAAPKVDTFQELMAIRGLPPIAPEEVAITGADPFYRTPFRIGELVSSVLAATGVAINDIWQLRGHERQRIGLDLPEVAAHLRAIDYLRQRGEDGAYHPVPLPPERAYVMNLCQPYRTRDGRWFLPHFSLGLGVRILGLLGCEENVESIAAAISTWDSAELEQAIADRGACGGIIRTREEWLAHPHGQQLARRPILELQKAGPADAEPFRPGERPLSGIRVLDLTRIIAGPLSARGLAEHGADVLMVTSRDMIQAPEHVRDTSQGKRSCFLDLKRKEDAARFASLVREADVVVNSYRPGALEALGFGMETLARLRPGIVQVSISCYGPGGPYAGRRGWEQIAQAVTGICLTQSRAVGSPRPQIIKPLVCDFTTGYLATYGALLALARRAREGGSWQVDVSLCRSSMLLQDLGLLEGFENAPEVLPDAKLAPLYVPEQGHYGDIRMLGPVLWMTATPPRWDGITPALGADAPAWLPR